MCHPSYAQRNTFCLGYQGLLTKRSMLLALASLHLSRNRQQRTLMGALITIDVHARDVVRFMVKTKVSGTARMKK